MTNESAQVGGWEMRCKEYHTLAHGRTVEVGAMTCRITEEGLQCDNGTGGAYFVNRSTIQLQ